MKDFEETYRGWHTKLSYIKSAVRIISCLTAAIFIYKIDVSMMILLAGIIIAEIIGILEERI